MYYFVRMDMMETYFISKLQTCVDLVTCHCPAYSNLQGM